MKRGDLFQIDIPWNDRENDHFEHLRGMFVIIIGKPITTKSPHSNEYIKCLCDKIRMIPTHWLKNLSS